MKAYFDDQIGLVPPPTIDVDQVIARQRRRMRLQRIGLSAGGGLAALAAVAVVFAVVPAGDAGEESAAGNSASPANQEQSATPAPSTPRGTDPSRPWGIPTEEPKQAEARLANSLRELVAAQAPTAQITGIGGQHPFQFTHERSWIPDKRALASQSSGTAKLTSPEGAEPDSQADSYTATANLTDQAGTSNAWINISSTKEARTFKSVLSCPRPGKEFVESLAACESTKGPHGELIMTWTLVSGYDGQVANSRSAASIPLDGSKHVVYQLFITRTDGAMVSFYLSNNANDGKRVSIDRNAPALTYDQMIKIGTDPKLTLYP